MRRATPISGRASAPAHPAASFSVERAFPASSTSVLVKAAPAVRTPVVPRVRDGLVLRVVAKSPVVRKPANELRAR